MGWLMCVSMKVWHVWLLPMRVGIAEVSNQPDSALGPNVAGTGMLHPPGSFNTDPRSDLGDKAEMASDKNGEWWVGSSSLL